MPPSVGRASSEPGSADGRPKALKTNGFSESKRRSGFSYPYHRPNAMSKLDRARPSHRAKARRRGVAARTASILAFSFFWGWLGCRPDTAAPATACRTDDDCADGQRCDDGGCRARTSAGTPPRHAVVGTAGERGRISAEPPRLQWELKAGAAISTTPALVATPEGPVAAVGTHAGRMVGVVAEGEQAGRLVLDLHVEGIVWSSPLSLGDGRIYFGADDDVLYAVDVATSTIAWRRRLGDCTPARAPGPEGTRCDVDGGPVAAPGGDLYVGANGLYRVAPDGTVRWHYPAAAGSPATHVASAPAVTDSLVVFGGHDGFVTALDHDGHERWRFSVGADVDGSPVVAADGTIVVGADGGRISALDPDDGSLVWVFATAKDVRSGIANGTGGVLFATSLDGRLYALDGQGAVRFIVPTEGPIASTPVVDPGGVVVFGSRDDRLYAVTGVGEVLWNLELPDDIDGGVAIAPGGTIVVGCDDGHLRGLR